MARASVTIRGAACAAVCLWASAGMAQDSALKSVMKLMGFATDVAPPADFVVKSRPEREPDFIPIFQPPPEPARPVLNDKELKATQGSLDSIEKQHDAVRQAFPPSAKAMAEQQAAAKTAKSKPPAANQ